MSYMSIVVGVALMRPICIVRHSLRSLAPMPAGLNSCSMAIMVSISSSVVYMLLYMASSSEMVVVSFLSSPSLSSEPMRYSIIWRWVSVMSSSPTCSASVSENDVMAPRSMSLAPVVWVGVACEGV